MVYEDTTARDRIVLLAVSTGAREYEQVVRAVEDALSESAVKRALRAAQLAGRLYRGRDGFELTQAGAEFLGGGPRALAG
jgi:hypothetical protein